MGDLVQYFTLMRPSWGVEYFTLDEARLGKVRSDIPWMRPGWGSCSVFYLG